MKRTTVIQTVVTVLAMSLTVLTIVLVRQMNLPSCYARVAEICLAAAPAQGLKLKGIEISRQLESERYIFSFRNPSGAVYDLTVVRSDSLGAGDGVSRSGAQTSRVETRMWNGAKSNSYFIGGSVPGVTTRICVEGLLWPRCGASGTLTRLTPYRG